MGDNSDRSELLILLLVVYFCAFLAWLMWKYLCNECGSSLGHVEYYNRPYCHHHYNGQDRDLELPDVSVPAGVENALRDDGYTYSGFNVGGNSGGDDSPE